jgi:hypothetical protein
MIKNLLAIAAVATAGLLAAPLADAGPSSRSSYTYRSGQSSCGCPVYTVRYVRGYDCYRRPIFAYRRAPLSHGHGCRHHQHVYRSHYAPPVQAYYRQAPSRYYGSRISSGGGSIRIGIGSSGYYQRGYSRGRGCR